LGKSGWRAMVSYSELNHHFASFPRRREFRIYAPLLGPRLRGEDGFFFATVVRFVFLIPPPDAGTFTSTIVIVSLPKMSTTFTAIFRLPGFIGCGALVSSSVRSRLVRNDCHSFSNTCS